MTGTNMLWSFSVKTMESGIRAGMEYFQAKYLSVPNIIYINPQYGLGVLDGVKVVSDPIVTPCHVYIGVE
jgi:hypothetical protein